MSTYHIDFINGNDANDGTSWANAWKSITNGATYSRVIPGDIVKIAKSPAPYSVGTATWTNQSRIVTLDTAQNATIDNCNTNWTAVTVNTNTETWQKKEGTGSQHIQTTGSTVAGKMAYFTLPASLDLSAYQRISFWLRGDGDVPAKFRICLCSDTAGDTVVDEFDVPNIYGYNWTSITADKIGGGNLGADIQSIAIYATDTPGWVSFYMDCFIACLSTGITLESLISKNATEQGGAEPWLPIASIDGATIMLDNGPNTYYGNVIPYYGGSENVETYCREAIPLPYYMPQMTQWAYIQRSGENGSPILYSAGWNTSTDTQDGESIFNGHCGNGLLEVQSKEWIMFEHIGFMRTDGFGLESNAKEISMTGGRGVAGGGSGGFIYANGGSIVSVRNVSITANNTGGVNASSDYGYFFENCIFTQNGSGIQVPLTSIFKDCLHYGNGNYNMYAGSSADLKIINGYFQQSNWGIYLSSYCHSMQVSDTIFGGHSSGSIYMGQAYSRNIVCKNCNFLDYNEVKFEESFSPQQVSSRLGSIDHDQTPNNHWQFFYGMKTYTQPNDRPDGAGLKWTYSITSNKRTPNSLPHTPLASFPVTANQQVSVNCWVKKDDATAVGARLVIKAGQVSFTNADMVADKGNDSDWSLLTITFTPIISQVVEVCGEAYYVSGYSSVHFADISIT